MIAPHYLLLLTTSLSCPVSGCQICFRVQCSHPLHRLVFVLGPPRPGHVLRGVLLFSSGQIKTQQMTMWPSCFSQYVDCDQDMVLHLAPYIQICGIMAGMILWGDLCAVIFHKWGSRNIAMIRLTGVILLTLSVYAPSAYTYFLCYLVAHTWCVMRQFTRRLNSSYVAYELFLISFCGRLSL